MISCGIRKHISYSVFQVTVASLPNILKFLFLKKILSGYHQTKSVQSWKEMYFSRICVATRSPLAGDVVSVHHFWLTRPDAYPSGDWPTQQDPHVSGRRKSAPREWCRERIAFGGGGCPPKANTFLACSSGRATRSWFLVCRVWRTPSPLRWGVGGEVCVWGEGHRSFLSGHILSPAPGCIHTLSHPYHHLNVLPGCPIDTSFSPLRGRVSHSSALDVSPIFSMLHILVIELGPRLHSILYLILPRNLHKVVDLGTSPLSLQKRDLN